MTNAVKLSYAVVPATAGVAVGPSGPRGLYSITCTVAGTVTVYDNASAASGDVVYTKVLAVGDVIHWGGNGMATKNGLFVVVVTGTMNIQYT